MNTISYPKYPTGEGYLTEKIRLQYIQKAIESKVLPENAHSAKVG